MKISRYISNGDEANFGAPIKSQVSGGTHITFEFLTKKEREFYMTLWPKGLPGHEDPPDTLRFPHGLIKFGESLEECAARLVSEQLGMRIKEVELLYWDSYVDDHNHWHIEPACLVEVTGLPKLPKAASEIVKFTLDDIPKMTYWKKNDFIKTVSDKLKL